MVGLMLRGEQPTWAASSDGSGSGDGYGYGYGSGDGSGSGSGSGSGDGYGSGDGDGYGSGSYWMKTIQYFADKWTSAQQARMEELRALGAKICFWRSKKDGTAIHGRKIEPATPGLVQSVTGPLKLCSSRALHGTLIPPKWEGDRLWVVALIGETVGDDEKYGALQREIIGECL